MDNHEFDPGQGASSAAEAYRFAGDYGLALWVKEQYDLDRRDVSLDSWAAWIGEYRGEVFDPPVAFDLRTPIPKDMTSPVSASQYWLHRFYDGIAAALYDVADDSGDTLLADWGITATSTCRGVWDWHPDNTGVTILLKGQKTLGENNYIVLLCRVEHNSIPKSHVVLFSIVTLREIEVGYVYTGDLEGSEIQFPFGDAPSIGMYSNLYNQLLSTDIPAHFYTIE